MLAKSMTALVAGTLAAGLMATTTAEAAPMRVSPRDTVVSPASVDQIAYRRYAGRRYVYRGGRRYYNPAGAAVAGAALGLLGAGIAAAAAPTYNYYPAYGYGYAPYGYGYGYRPYYGW